MWHLFFVAFGLVCILEGLLPFLAPHIWRQAMQQMIMQTEKTLRVFGLISMLIGLGLVYFFN